MPEVVGLQLKLLYCKQLKGVYTILTHVGTVVDTHHMLRGCLRLKGRATATGGESTNQHTNGAVRASEPPLFLFPLHHLHKDILGDVNFATLQGLSFSFLLLFT